MPYRFTKYSPNYNKIVQEPKPLEKISLETIKSGDQITLTLETPTEESTLLELIIKNIAQPMKPATALASAGESSWNNQYVIIHGSWSSLDGNEFYPNELFVNCYPEIEWIDKSLVKRQEKELKKKGVIRVGDIKWTKTKLKALYPDKHKREEIIQNLLGKRRELFPKIIKITKIGLTPPQNLNHP